MIATEESTASGAATGATAGGAKAKSPGRIFAEVAHKTAERVIENQKSVFDLLKHQQAAATEVVKTWMPAAQSGAVIATMDVMRSSVDRLAEAGKESLDLAVRQSAIFTDAVAEVADQFRFDVQGPLADAMKEAGESAVSAQRTMLDFASKQTDLAAEWLKQPLTEAGKAPKNVVESAAASMRKGVDILLETQKQFLDIASRPVKAKAARSGPAA